MTLELANKLFEDINKSGLLLLKNDLINYAVEYSKIRVDWYIADEEAKEEMEDFRTVKHNAFIDSCNILNREMIKAGEDATWRKTLGNDRIVIGEFACFINLILEIKAR